jgi:hypothetical protein
MIRRIVLLPFTAASLGAQQSRVTQLRPAIGALAEALPARPLNETLDGPRAVRELSDGSVLMLDGARLLAADFTSGKSRELTELKPRWIVPLAADTTIVSTTNGWAFLVGTRSVGALPPDNPVVQLIASRPVGADDRASIVSLSWPRRRGDSIEVALVNRMTGDRDVVTRLWPGNPQAPGTFRPVCQVYERAVMAPDGWLAVLRAKPYRVEWRAPDGTWTRGSPIPTPVIRMTERERAVYLEWRARERPPLPRDTVRSWPETVCPFIGGYAPIPTPDGKLLVYRVPTTEAPATRYDVVNRRGEVERQIALPPSDAIIGFGPRSVYVVTTEGRTQRVHRHPWP